MTYPPIYTSILKKKDKQLGIGKSSDYQAISYLYYETVVEIRNQFFRQKMANISEEFINVIESDLRTMIDKISSELEIKDRDFLSARTSLDIVYREITTWLMLLAEKDFDQKVSNFRERSQALINVRNELEKAIKYWPKKGFDQYRKKKS